MLETREHTSSCFAATRKSETNYPLLEGEHRCDVAVVGAGHDVLPTKGASPGFLRSPVSDGLRRANRRFHLC
jgi:hypothetical protein